MGHEPINPPTQQQIPCPPPRMFLSSVVRPYRTSSKSGRLRKSELIEWDPQWAGKGSEELNGVRALYDFTIINNNNI